MARTPQFDQLLDRLEHELDGISRSVFLALRQAYPARLSREQLCERVYGYVPDRIENSTEDRAIRLAIADMLQRGYPVMSSSGKAGYWLTADVEEVDNEIAECRSRKARLDERERALEKVKTQIHRLGTSAIPNDMPARQQATQATMFWRD